MPPLTPQQHQRTATIPASKGYPRGRFPMPDRRHAELALELLPTAKNMSAGEDTAVRARATRILAAKRVTGR
jgi:hypothetical protein